MEIWTGDLQLLRLWHTNVALCYHDWHIFSKILICPVKITRFSKSLISVKCNELYVILRDSCLLIFFLHLFSFWTSHLDAKWKIFNTASEDIQQDSVLVVKAVMVIIVYCLSRQNKGAAIEQWKWKGLCENKGKCLAPE